MNNQIKNYQMPFGKHIGKPLEEVPLKYLDWLIGQTWFKIDMPVSYNYVAEYLADPVVKKELEGELDED